MQRVLELLTLVNSRVRLAILYELLKSSETRTMPPTKVLADRIGVRESVCSHHLTILRNGGLVTTVNSGNYAHHRLRTETVEELLELLSFFLRDGIDEAE